MSTTQVVVVAPTRTSSMVSPSSSSVAASKSINTNSTKAAKLARLRAPPKPQIQIDKGELKKKLTPLQYRVTQEKHTERPFSGEYLKLNDHGMYCCVVCDEELFSSETKFDSGCGWPAFYNVVDNKKVILQADLSHVGGNLLLLALNQDLARTEVTCAKCGAHLGHLFDDGPKPTGKRYCVNSASLKFEHVTNNCDACPNDQQKSPMPPTTIDDLATTNSHNNANNNSRTIVNNDEKTKQGNGMTPKNVDSSSTTTTSSLVSNKASTDNRSPFSNSPKQSIIKKITNEPSTPTVSNGSAKSNEQSWKVGWFMGPNNKTSKSLSITSNDSNNNRIVLNTNKYSSVKSRYLDHLNSASKDVVIKHTSKRSSSAGATSNRSLLETHL